MRAELDRGYYPFILGGSGNELSQSGILDKQYIFFYHHLSLFGGWIYHRAAEILDAGKPTREPVGEDAYSQYNSEVTLTKNEVIQKLQEYHSDIEMNFENENEIQILENTESGRVKTIKFGNIQITGTETRTIFGLRSANFTVKIEGDNVIFEVLGYGHGVGMSQTGADSMAKLGNNYETIIKHYYTGVEIQNIS